MMFRPMGVCLKETNLIQAEKNYNAEKCPYNKMHFGCDLSMGEYVKDFELLGYTHDEAIELTKAAIEPITINPAINWGEIVEAFNNIGCTSFQMTADEIKEILERQENA